MKALIRRLRARRSTGDDGMTMMELLVGMSIMSIFMAVSTSAIVGMFSSTGKIQTLQHSASQLNIAFNQLDKQVRYATVIYRPTGPATVPATSDWSVAFETDNPSSTTCTQLKIRAVAAGSGQLQLVERTWNVTVNSDGSLTQTAISNWSQLAVGISLTDQNQASVTPFAVSTPTGGTVQQLRLRLVDMDGTSQSLTKSFTEIGFSALNSATASSAYPTGSTSTTCTAPVNP
jgi:prepilin-type N-terminal cleavage/methylation domain-containing protein